jgi:sulfopyruvate decarboxylase TPP-binding subunit
MKNFIVGVPDKLLTKWLEGKDYMCATDEGEAVGIASGVYMATNKRATVFMSADGFCNALNPLTSLVIPEGIKMNFVISLGRQEPQHKVMSDSVKKIIKAIKYEPANISFFFVSKEPERSNRWVSWFDK